MSCGLNGWDDWDRVVIEGWRPWSTSTRCTYIPGAEDYWTNVLSPHQVGKGDKLHEQPAYPGPCTTSGSARTPASPTTNGTFGTAPTTAALEERYSFADALAVATYLNIFVRNCDWVRMANLAQMVNAIAPIVTTKTGAFVQPIYYPVLLHAQAALDEAVDACVSRRPSKAREPGDRWQHRIADLGPFSTIDASATSDAGEDQGRRHNRQPGPRL